MLLHDAANNVILSREEIGQANVVSFQRPPGVFLDQSHTGTMKNGRYRTIENAVDLGGLCEVRNLSGAAIVSDRRQEIILDHSAQGHVGTETFRLTQGPGC